MMASDTEEAPEENHVIDTATLLRTQPLVAGMRQLYCSEDFTDLEIICQERVWKVHKFCLCAQSEFFQSACGGNFLEAANSRISLDDDEPETVAGFIHYLYHFEYTSFQQNDCAPIVFHIRMYMIADKYLVEALKDLAAKQFEEAAKEEWHTKTFADAIAEVYGTAAKDSRLKGTIVGIVSQNGEDLLDPDQGYDAFHEVLGELSEFARDIAVNVSFGCYQHRWYQCPKCHRQFTMHNSVISFRCPCCNDGAKTQFFWEWKTRLVDC